MEIKQGALLVITGIITGILFSSCQKQTEEIQPAKDVQLFSLLQPDSTGICFKNFLNDMERIVVSDDTGLMLNRPTTINDMPYQYAGGGVAVGDINNDGLLDLFFTSNQNPSRLYLNMGNFKFKDITDEAGIKHFGGWTTGAVMADVNGDGLTDIYVCRAGYIPKEGTENLLFINNGNLSFSEEAAKYGIDDRGLSISASFFDFDCDGDLDLYVMNYPYFDGDPLSFFFYEIKPDDELTSDRLYENMDGVFKNVSSVAGLPVEKGAGLGLVVTDINLDGWPDIYVANDLLANDYVYINQGNGTFINENDRLFTKNSFFSMGCDIADVTNNGLPDIFVADMAPSSHYRRNVMLNQSPINYYFLQSKYNKTIQYGRNVLQQNRNGKFSELAEMLGIARSDWSWSALFADFDNDRYKDLFIANGMKRDVGNMDFEMLMYQEEDEVIYTKDFQAMLNNYPKHYALNCIFKNNPTGRWQPKMEEWGLNQAINSQGAAYADLNNDGLMDLIVNPTDTFILIYKNNGIPGHNYLSIKVKGKNKNTMSLGTKAWLYYGGQQQYAELTNARGFQSSSQPRLHFGLGTVSTIDSMVIVYPLGDYDVLYNIEANQELTLSEGDARHSAFSYQRPAGKQLVVEDHSEKISPAFVHQESDFNDFKRDKLNHRMFSKEGPAVAAGDLNGDGMDDFFAGGAAGQASATYFQTSTGQFTRFEQPELDADAGYEDVDAVIFDVNGDGFNDLYVASGSNEFPLGSDRYSDRVYLNDGSGKLIRCLECLPDIIESSSCVAVHDYNHDGYPDLFVGGRTVPERYGLLPNSYLLRNNNGIFEDVTSGIAPGLSQLGMVNDAIWEDLDDDGEKELIIAGEWMPVTVFRKSSSTYENVSTTLNLNEKGWWSSVYVSDINGDGHKDILAGNWGLNSIYQANSEQPVSLLVNDFDGDGIEDPILCIYLQDTLNTFLGRNEICAALTNYFNKYTTYKQFATTSLEEKFSRELHDSAMILAADELQSCVFINNGKGGYDKISLPFQLQSAPVKEILEGDFTQSGQNEYLIMGGTNQHYFNEGHIDGLGARVIRWNTGMSNFEEVPLEEGPLAGYRFIKGSAQINVNGEQLILAGYNDDSLQLVRVGSTLRVPSGLNVP